MDWFINIGGFMSSTIAIIYIIRFFKYIFCDKISTVRINIYSTLIEHYKKALASSAEEVREYFLTTFPIDNTAIVNNEFISRKKNDIVAEIEINSTNNLAFILGSDEYEIKILDIYNSEDVKILPHNVHERTDIVTKNRKKLKSGQININKGEYITFLTQELGPEASPKVRIEIQGHKILIILSPNQKHGAVKYIKAKNSIKSFLVKYF